MILDSIMLAIGVLLSVAITSFLYKMIKDYREEKRFTEKLEAHTRSEIESKIKGMKSGYALLAATMVTAIVFSLTLAACFAFRIYSESLGTSLPVAYYVIIMLNALSMVCETILMCIAIYKRCKFEL